MEVPCVRVPREEGESVRRRLAEADLIDQEMRIDASDGWLYIPVRKRTHIPEEYELVTHDCEPRSTQTLPRDLLDEEPTYERLGNIGLIDEDDPERAKAIAAAIIESSLPIRTVLNAQSRIEGEYRVRDWQLLAGSETETIHREYGAEFRVDPTEVYFSPRLATERHRVIEQVEPGECAFDMFAGVGPFAIPMAMRGASVIAVDANPRAIEYLEDNAERNNVTDRLTAINADVRSVAPEHEEWADRIVMNLPHRADAFLEAAGIIAGETCRLHYYDIQPDDAPFAAGERAISAALGDQFDIEIGTRREVRSYAPHEVNVCLDVDLTRT